MCLDNQVKIQISPEAVARGRCCSIYSMRFSLRRIGRYKAAAGAENEEEQRTLTPWCRAHLLAGLIKRTSFAFNEYFRSTLVLGLSCPVFFFSRPVFRLLVILPPLFRPSACPPSSGSSPDPLSFTTARLRIYSLRQTWRSREKH